MESGPILKTQTHLTKTDYWIYWSTDSTIISVQTPWPWTPWIPLSTRARRNVVWNADRGLWTKLRNLGTTTWVPKKPPALGPSATQFFASSSTIINPKPIFIKSHLQEITCSFQKVSKTHLLAIGLFPCPYNKTLHFLFLPSHRPPFHPSSIPQHHPHLRIGSIHLFSIIQHLHRDASLFLHIALQKTVNAVDFSAIFSERESRWSKVGKGWVCNVSKKTPRFNSDSEAVNSSNNLASWRFPQGMFRNLQGWFLKHPKLLAFVQPGFNVGQYKSLPQVDGWVKWGHGQLRYHFHLGSEWKNCITKRRIVELVPLVPFIDDLLMQDFQYQQKFLKNEWQLHLSVKQNVWNRMFLLETTNRF